MAASLSAKWPVETPRGPDALARRIAPELDARLERSAPTPVAVAFSGGGDSLALLLAAEAWAAASGRPLQALTLDHGLQSAGADWARWCAERCRRLGVPHEILAWEGPKPVTGISAAARTARHALLAEAARRHGARVILMGHTADDILEARLMRAAGSNVGDPAVWAPSPAWPRGLGVFLLRPFLSVRRSDLRAALSDLGETWIDDPANVDMATGRARARAQLAATPAPHVALAARIDAIELFDSADIGPEGSITMARAALAAAAPDRARLFVGAALLCAAGTTRPPRRRSLDLVLARLAAGETFAATLAGCRFEATAATVGFEAEPPRRPRRGDTASGPILACPLPLTGDLVKARLAGACGAIRHEAAIGRVAEWAATP